MTFLKYIQSIPGKTINYAITTGNFVWTGIQQEYNNAKSHPKHTLKRFVQRTQYEPPSNVEHIVERAINFDIHKTYPVLTRIRLKIKPYDKNNVVNDITVLCLLLTIIIPFIAYVVSKILLHKKTEKTIRLIYVWYLSNAVFYLVFGTSYVYYSFKACSKTQFIGHGAGRTHCGVAFSDNLNALVWREYSRADSRFAENDQMILSMQIFATVVHGMIGGLICWLIWYNKRISWFWLAVVAMADVYGTFLRVCTEWLGEWKHWRVENWLYFGVYIVGYNGLTVVMSLMVLKVARDQCDRGIRAMRRLHAQEMNRRR